MQWELEYFPHRAAETLQGRNYVYKGGNYLRNCSNMNSKFLHFEMEIYPCANLCFQSFVETTFVTNIMVYLKNCSEFL